MEDTCVLSSGVLTMAALHSSPPPSVRRELANISISSSSLTSFEQTLRLPRQTLFRHVQAGSPTTVEINVNDVFLCFVSF